MRKSGILLPIFSLPSKCGIGTFGKEAFNFVNFLKKSKQKLWQILPINPTSFGDSPYQSFSTFAGNPYFIDFDLLCERGLLEISDYEKINWESKKNYVDYSIQYNNRFNVLRKAFDRFVPKDDYLEFKQNNDWLDDYSLFMVIKQLNGQKSWADWEDKYRFRDADALNGIKEKYKRELEFQKFIQYEFYRQFNLLKRYANVNGVQIVGDLPIYVAYDSADTWANPELFNFDKDLKPIDVAGCPPDAFSTTGQLWGNPIYKWEKHKETNYKWWIDRISVAAKIYDLIRIDHFRGFDEYYSIPADHKTAEFGKWRQGPSTAFFKFINERVENLNIIAEDLGYITPSVKEMLKETGYPGMKVLQFAIDPNSNSDSEYLPHNHIKNCVVYTGTHDNDTLASFVKTLSREQVRFAREYFNSRIGLDKAIIKSAFSSCADTCICQMQDFLRLGNEARINLPSTIGTNWKWRLEKNMLDENLAQRIAKLTTVYKRA